MSSNNTNKSFPDLAQAAIHMGPHVAEQALHTGKEIAAHVGEYAAAGGVLMAGHHAYNKLKHSANRVAEKLTGSDPNEPKEGAHYLHRPMGVKGTGKRSEYAAVGVHHDHDVHSVTLHRVHPVGGPHSSRNGDVVVMSHEEFKHHRQNHNMEDIVGPKHVEKSEFADSEDDGYEVQPGDRIEDVNLHGYLAKSVEAGFVTAVFAEQPTKSPMRMSVRDWNNFASAPGMRVVRQGRILPEEEMGVLKSGFFTRHRGHDVSGEPRNEHGEWTHRGTGAIDDPYWDDNFAARARGESPIYASPTYGFSPDEEGEGLQSMMDEDDGLASKGTAEKIMNAQTRRKKPHANVDPAPSW